MWAAMLRAALARGLAPEAFWRLSLAEWRMLNAAAPGATPMARDDYDRLAEAWPDD